MTTGKANYLAAEARRLEFLELLSQGLRPKEACETIGIHPNTYQAWRTRDHFFAAEADSRLSGARVFKDEGATWEGFADFRKKFFGHDTPFHQAMIIKALEETGPGDITLILVPPEHGKALALETPIPTPTGWTTMGEVDLGDEVIATDGTVTKVSYKSPVWLKPTFRVTLDDKSEFFACEDHRWTVRLKGRKTQILTTRQLASLPSGLQPQLPLVEPFEGVPTDLPIHPYVLGVWLGDGHSAGGRITCADQEILDRICSLGYELVDGGCHNTGKARIYRIKDDADRRLAEEKARRLVLDEGYSYAAAAKATGLGEGNIHGIVGPVEGRYVGCRPRVQAQHVEAVPKIKFFQSRLADLGLLNNKHIPVAYLRAPLADRMELLKGLMDTDGWCSLRGSAGIGFSDERLRDDVLDLLCGLGYKPMVSRHETTHRDSYRMGFCTDHRDVFTLPRKLVRQRRGPKRDRRVVKVEKIEPVPTQCLQVDHPSHSFAIGRAWVYGMNTTLFEDYACMKLALDSEYRITVGCEAQGLSRRILGRIKNRMDPMGPFKKYVAQFGPFAPENMSGRATHQVWAADYFNVNKRVEYDERDYSMVGIGFGSNIIGSRTDHLHCDDLQSTKTLGRTEQMLCTFQQDWLTRPGESGITTINGTRAGDGDFYEALIAEFEGENWFRVVKLPAVLTDFTTGEQKPLWPRDENSKARNKGYTMEQLDKIKRKVGPDVWSRSYMQDPRSSGLGTFNADIVDRCMNPERPFTADTLPLGPGCPVYIGLDPALGGVNCLMAWQIGPEKLALVDLQEDVGLQRNEDIMTRLEMMIIRLMARGGRVTDVVVEANNFQRGLARDERFKDLSDKYGFAMREHLTNISKYDADIGVASMVTSFIKREVDIPFAADERTRDVAEQFKHQLLRWRPGIKGNILRQDQVMAMWFCWILWQSRRRTHPMSGATFKSHGLPWKPTSTGSGLLVPTGGSPFFGG